MANIAVLRAIESVLLTTKVLNAFDMLLNAIVWSQPRYCRHPLLYAVKTRVFELHFRRRQYESNYRQFDAVDFEI